MTFDAYGMINRGSCILTVLHLYSDCSKHKLSTILTANAANLARFVTSRHFDSKKLLVFLCILSLWWFLYDWITIMEFSKHEISTINMLYSLKKICHITPLPRPPFHNGYFLLFPRGLLWKCSTVTMHELERFSVSFSAIPAQRRRENPFRTSSEGDKFYCIYLSLDAVLSLQLQFSNFLTS